MTGFEFEIELGVADAVFEESRYYLRTMLPKSVYVDLSTVELGCLRDSPLHPIHISRPAIAALTLPLAPSANLADNGDGSAGHGRPRELGIQGAVAGPRSHIIFCIFHFVFHFVVARWPQADKLGRRRVGGIINATNHETSIRIIAFDLNRTQCH